MVEPMISGLHTKWRISKTQATAIMCCIGFVFSLFFATGSGLHWLDIVDHFIANFGLVMIGLVECLILGWIYQVSKLRIHANDTSEIQIGKWWEYLIKFVIPFVLFILLVITIIDNISNPYLGYPWWVIVIGGVIPPLSIFLLSFVLMKIKKHPEAA
jgi:NSS family neurotransmitter:Na+ symporter